MKESPLVSILMTSYNREKYIAEAIESVLASSYKNYEFIIVDDVSSDKTVEIALQYALKDKRIHVYVNSKNLGDYPNRNKAAVYAKGKYIKYLDSDDKIYDFGLEYCINEMEKYPEAAIGMAVHYDIGAENSICWTSEEILRQHFFVKPYLWIGPSGAIYKREEFLKLGGFDTRFGVSSDMYFNIRMASISPVVLFQRDFFYYREHEGQERNNEEGYLTFGYLYFREVLDKVKLPFAPEEIEFLRRKMKKRHSVNLTRYLIKRKNISDFRKIMHNTNFNWVDYMLGFFN